MKAVAVTPSRREVGLVEHEEPQIVSPTDVKLRVLDVGVCATDREICAFVLGTPPPGCDYLIVGHEALAEVVAVGQGVSAVTVGDLVVPMVRRPCPHEHCIACRHQRSDLCFTGDFTERGIKLAHGYMTAFAVDDDNYLHRVPAELRDVAVLVEPLTIAEKAFAQAWQLQERLPWVPPRVPGEQPAYRQAAVVLGAGPVGLLGAAALVARGLDTYVYSREPASDPRARFADAIGATYVCSETDSVQRLAQRMRRIDLVYEALGAADIAFDVMRALGPNGVYIVTGVPRLHRIAQFDTESIISNLVLKNQVIYGSVNAGAEAYAAAIRDLSLFMHHWPDAIRSLITALHPIDAYRDLLLGRPDGIKNVIALEFGD